MALILIFLATAFLSMWMSNTATAAMMLPLVIGLLDRVPAEKLKTTAPFAILGVAYSASIGGMGTLVGSPPNAIAAHALGMGFAEWFRIAMPIVLVFRGDRFLPDVPVPPPESGDACGYGAGGKGGNGGQVECQAGACPYSLRAGGRELDVQQFPFLCFGRHPVHGHALIALSAAVLLPLCGVINWSGIAKNTDWGVLLLFGGGITLSSILVQTGAAGFLADQVSSRHGAQPHRHPAHHQPLHHVADGILFQYGQRRLVAPLMVTVASAMGMSATPLVLLVGIGASCAFMLPVSTPPNALAFATGKFPQMTMVKVGLLINVVLVFVKAFWAWIFWM